MSAFYLSMQFFYNNGRGSIKADPGLCPDPNWPAADSGNANNDCWVNAARNTRCAAICAVIWCLIKQVVCLDGSLLLVCNNVLVDLASTANQHQQFIWC